MVIKEFEGTGNWILVKNEREYGIKNPPSLTTQKHRTDVKLWSMFG